MAAILREIIACENTNDKISRFFEASRTFTHPTIIHNTPLDRAIDLALLLWGDNFKKGYGDGVTGVTFAEKHSLTVNRLGLLVADLGKHVLNFKTEQTLPVQQRIDDIVKLQECGIEKISTDAQAFCLSATTISNKNKLKENSLTPLHEFVIVKDTPDVGCLTRFSVDMKILDRLSPRKGRSEILDHLSRTLLLNDVAVMAAAAGIQDFGDNRTYSASEVRNTVLERAVRQGLEFVLQRPDFVPQAFPVVRRNESDSTVIGGSPCLDGTYRIEPSITCPSVRFGSLTTINSRDIDSLLSLRHLATKFIADRKWNGPLPLVVFGKPGAGKNTIIRTVLDSVKGCEFDPALSCNLAQWANTESLSQHFHKIQDRTLHADKPPVVLFDEFDTPLAGQPVGWLKYFLMPMQDGLYMVGNDTFHIGRAIFVFAGGVAHSYAEFKKKFVNAKHDDAKVVDFLSRLRGHIDVQDIALSGVFRPEKESSIADQNAQIQRAIILRGLLSKHMAGIFDKAKLVADMDPSLIYAFLNIRSFKHGVRSMEAILQMSRISSGTTSYQPSALPPNDQLDLHVDAKKFMELVRSYSSHNN